MGGIKYVDSHQYTLNPYTSQKTQIMFYFPAQGAYVHQPSNISENLMVIAKSQPKEIKVLEKRIITNVQTFSDLMKTTKGEEEKKKLIINLIKNSQDKLTDPKYQYDSSAQDYYMSQDPQFFLDVLDLMRNNGTIDQISRCG